MAHFPLACADLCADPECNCVFDTRRYAACPSCTSRTTVALTTFLTTRDEVAGDSDQDARQVPLFV